MKTTLLMFAALTASAFAQPFEDSAATTVSPVVEHSQSKPDLRAFHYSIAALVAAQSFDAASSYGLEELNPVLGRGQFGARQVAVKSVMVAAVVVAEVLIVRKYPKSAKVLGWVNFADAGVTGAVAAHNMRLR